MPTLFYYSFEKIYICILLVSLYKVKQKMLKIWNFASCKERTGKKPGFENK